MSLRQLQQATVDVGFELNEGCCADDIGGHEGTRGDKGERHVRRVKTVLPGERNISGDGAWPIPYFEASQTVKQPLARHFRQRTLSLRQTFAAN